MKTYIVILLSIISAKAFCMDDASRMKLESLIDATLPFAEQMLNKNKEFYPFGAALVGDGKIIGVSGYDGDDHPKSSDLIKIIADACTAKAKSGEYLATALVYDVKIMLPGNSDKSDAIAIALDSKAVSIVVVYPYSFKDDKLQLGEQFVQAGNGNIFK